MYMCIQYNWMYNMILIYKKKIIKNNMSINVYIIDIKYLKYVRKYIKTNPHTLISSQCLLLLGPKIYFGGHFISKPQTVILFS